MTASAASTARDWRGRIEDDPLLRGVGRFGDDIRPAGALFAHFVRSPHGFAKIEHIDAAAAKSVKGVAAVFTPADTHLTEIVGRLVDEIRRAHDLPSWSPRPLPTMEG